MSVPETAKNFAITLFEIEHDPVYRGKYIIDLLENASSTEKGIIMLLTLLLKKESE